MKILFITNDTTGTSGWSRYTVDLIQSLATEGNIIETITSDELGHTNNYLLGSIFGFKERKIVKEKIEKFKPDIIHVVAEPYIFSLLFMNLKNIKVFMTIHGTYSFLPALFKKNSLKYFVSVFLMKNILKKITGIISVSSFTKEYFKGEYKKVFKRECSIPLRVITNGINCDRLSSQIKNVDKKGIHIVSVGEVKNRKGHHFAVRAIKSLKKDVTDDIKYHVVGTLYEDSKYHKNLLKKIKDYGLDDNVVFYGKSGDSELLELYNKASIFIMLSQNIDKKFEGFGIVYLEANIFGVPTIGSLNTGAQEAILDGKTGYLVDPNNTESVVERIKEIVYKKSIFPDDCKKWSQNNDILLKSREMLDFYNQ